MDQLNQPGPIDEGVLAGAVYVPSPNCNDRPADGAVDLLVLHNISLPPGQFGSGCVTDFFTNTLDPARHPYFETIAGLQVSAHLLIERDGRVIQFVPFHRRAWHAGVSCWQGREQCNDYSIGIELEGTDDTPYTDAQYSQLVRVVHSLQQAYPALTAERIVGHSDIAAGRKTDPGTAFDWRRFRGELEAVT
nr:1,6-anhydro-N-acetylmuramyl-L-alanine amidase AmpD [Motiliproteus sediminis]